ncbi:Uncharacterised protein [Burkholderia pseudomallei]|nr:Uncharacterised protein [Burkholderia pseudomallei]
MTLELHDGALQIFDVDHGQCALLTLPGPTRVHRVLIDCGHSVDFQGAPWHPGAHLSGLGINYVDVLMCMNFDEDHVSGYPDLVRRGIQVGAVFGNPTVPPEAIAHMKAQNGMGAGIAAIAATLASRRTLGISLLPQTVPGLGLTWACNRYPFFDDENSLSLVVMLDIHGFKFLFPGDMESCGFRHMLATYPPFRQTVASIDVLVAAHHGRENGICTEMFDDYGCRPELVVISDDYKQYDTQETTSYYARKARGITNFRGQGPRYVLTTRNDGEVIFSFRDGRCFVL